MSNIIDSKIVEARFDNKQFEQGVSGTLSSLDKLKNSLKLDGATKGLENVSTAASRFSLAPLHDGVEKVKASFSAMTVVATAAIATIVSQAVRGGEKLAKAFTVGPLLSGLHEYETNLNSIQTVLANTGLKGQKGLDEVNGALADLNHYSDQTIYNFSEMARNIGTFTAAGVKLKPATAAIKGIANLAAVSGSSADQASTAMYQLSQAMSTGTVKLMDWNSVVNAGMGGKVFQEAIKETARAHGVGIDAIIKKEGSFRDSLQTGWLSSGILTETLQKFTGDMSAAQLKQLGYTDKQIAGIIEMGKTAKDAATKVKTFSQLMGTLKEAAGSGWTQTWQLIIGDFDQAKTLWTNVNNVLGGMIQGSANARNKLIGDWNKLGGRTKLIDAIGTSFKAVMTVLNAIKHSFREIFPAKTGQDLYNLTVMLDNFAHGLIMSHQTLDKVKSVFAGFFATLDIGKQVISGVIHAVADLFGGFGSGAAGGMLDFLARIGDTLVYLDKTLKSSNGVEDFFNNLEGPMHAIQAFLTPIIHAFQVIFGLAPSADQLGRAVSKVGQSLSPLQSLGHGVAVVFTAIWHVIEKIGPAIGKAFVGIGQGMANAFSPENVSHILDLVNAGLLGGILVLLKKFMDGGKLNVSVGGGFLKNMTEAMGQVTQVLQGMQANIKANAIMKIAISLGILAAALLVLSTINPKQLMSALVAMGTGLAIMQISLSKMADATGVINTMKLPLLAASLTAVATAMLLLALAVKVMASMEFADMLRGLTGLAGALFIIQKAMGPLSANASGMIRAATALTILGVALNLIAVATKVFATMSWEEMGKGLTGLAGSLVVLAAAMRLMPRGMIAQAAALTILGVAINEIALALKVMGTIQWDTMGRGLTALAGSLVIIAGAMRLMPKNMVLQAAALVAVAGALNIIALALKVMGTMSWESIGKGLVTLGGAMLILAVGLNVMRGALPGAAALLVAAAALAVLTPVLVTLGLMSWEAIAKGLTVLAAAFVIIGVAGYALAPIVPVILGLSAAILLIASGFAIASVGALALATAFAVLVAAAAAGISVVAGLIEVMIKALPGALRAVGEGIVQIVTVLTKAQPQFTAMFVAMMASILDAVIKNAPKMSQAFLAMLNALLDVVIKGVPKIGQAFLTLVMTGLKVLTTAVPAMAEAGLKILLGVLTAISNNIYRIVAVAATLIVNFINGVAANLGKVIDAGVKLIIAFINGISDAIDAHAAELGAAGGRLAVAVIKGMVKGLAAGVGEVANAAKDVAKHALDGAKNFLGIHSPSKEFEKVGLFINQGLIQGLEGNKDQVQAAFDHLKDLIRTSKEAAAKDITDLTATIAKKKHELLDDDKAIAAARQALRDAENRDFVAQAKSKVPIEQQRKAFAADQAHDIDATKDKLDRLIYARNQDNAAIAAATRALAEARAEYGASSAAYANLTQKMGEHVRQLQSLADQMDANNEKIKQANSDLDAAIKSRDDYKKQISDSYSALPDINKDTTLADYVAGLQAKTDNVEAFTNALDELKNYGLSDELYQEFLKKGVDTLPFIQEVLKGGAESVTQLNVAATNLKNTAQALGTTASNALYQAGVDSAQGLLNGLKSKEAELAAEMARIAAIIAQTAQAKLKIKSPSRVFMKIGVFTAEGMAQGLRDATPSVEKAAADLGLGAMDSMRNSISELSMRIGENMDLQPTITPVLDLTSVQRDALRVSSMLTDRQIKVDAAYSKATDVSAGYRSNRDAATPDVTAGDTPASVTFVQNNNSPKALSTADIYRNTNNQISKAKGVLTNAGSS